MPEREHCMEVARKWLATQVDSGFISCIYDEEKAHVEDLARLLQRERAAARIEALKDVQKTIQNIATWVQLHNWIGAELKRLRRLHDK